MSHSESTCSPEQIDITRDDFDHLVERATAGSPEALAELRATLRANRSMYRRLGDLSLHVQASLLELITRDSVVARESIDLNLEELRTSLQLDGNSPLEMLLVEQIVTTWLDWSFQQIAFSQGHATEEIARRREQRLERAQKRHLAAIQALNDIRAFS